MQWINRQFAGIWPAVRGQVGALVFSVLSGIIIQVILAGLGLK